jgi:hypothetical protein
VPAAAESVFEKLYPPAGDSIALPYPFGDLLADLKRKSGGAEIRSAFIPLGRSLQRYAADPDFFGSPRIVSGVTGHGTGEIAVKDRLYFGYQPASEAIEIIAFDEEKGRFVFQEVTGYGAGKAARLAQIDDAVCAGCHQSNGPIFAAAPWSESNANPAVVEKLAKSFHGVEVKQDFDGVDFLDRSTRRANRLTAAAMIWREGCSTRACRAALLGEAVRFKLGAAPSETSFLESLAARWPDGLKLAPSKVPDRDPVTMLAEGKAPSEAIEALGVFDPETRRQPAAIWTAREDGAAGAARLVSELLPMSNRFVVHAESSARERVAADFVKKLDEIVASDFKSAVLEGAMPTTRNLTPLLDLAFGNQGGSP